MTGRLSAMLAELRRGLEEIYGERLVKMVLFGSQARGDAEDGSDIDVLVVLRGEHGPEEEARADAIAAELSLRNDVVIICMMFSSERYDREQSPLLINVRREGVAI